MGLLGHAVRALSPKISALISINIIKLICKSVARTFLSGNSSSFFIFMLTRVYTVKKEETNLLKFSFVNSVSEIPAFSNPTVKLFRDVCTENPAVLRCVHRKNWTTGFKISEISKILFTNQRLRKISIPKKNVIQQFVSGLLELSNY